jgi:hypothetical protein
MEKKSCEYCGREIEFIRLNIVWYNRVKYLVCPSNLKYKRFGGCWKHLKRLIDEKEVQTWNYQDFLKYHQENWGYDLSYKQFRL